MGCEKMSVLNVELCMHTYARVCYHDGSQGKNWKWNADPSAKHLSHPLCSTFPTGSGFLCICLDKIQQHNKNCNHRHSLHSLDLYPSVCMHGTSGHHGISSAWWSSMSPNVNCLYSPLEFLPCLGQRSASQIMFWRVMRCHQMCYISYIRNTRKVTKKDASKKIQCPC